MSFAGQAKANTASPACRKIPSGILPEGKPVLGKFENRPSGRFLNLTSSA